MISGVFDVVVFPLMGVGLFMNSESDVDSVFKQVCS